MTEIKEKEAETGGTKEKAARIECGAEVVSGTGVEKESATGITVMIETENMVETEIESVTGIIINLLLIYKPCVI